MECTQDGALYESQSASKGLLAKALLALPLVRCQFHVLVWDKLEYLVCDLRTSTGALAARRTTDYCYCAVLTGLKTT